MSSLKSLETTRGEIMDQIHSLGDMRRGSLVERYLPCGKEGCHCTRPDSRGHGPKYSVTWKVSGKTKTEYVSEEEVPQVREQLETHRRFLQLSKDLVDVNEEICRLRKGRGEVGESKKNSAKRSSGRLRKKSTGS